MSTGIANNRLDRWANFVTISTCLIVCAVVLIRYFGQSTVQPTELLPAGKLLKSADGVRFDEARLTVLVGLKSNCKYCGESMPALRRLEAYVNSRNDSAISMVAVGTESLEGLTKYLEFNQLRSYRPVSVDLNSILAPVALRTPTVALVDETGLVLAARAGVLTQERAGELISRMEASLEGREPRVPSPGFGGGQ